MPDLKPVGEPERLRSGWLNGIKHWQVDYTGKMPGRSRDSMEDSMDFTPDPAQQAVADVVTSVLDRDNSGTRWSAGGVTALPVPERLGGDGVGLPEIATALTEIGRHGAITPALATLGLRRGAAAGPGLRRAAGPVPGGVAKGAVLTAALNEPGAALPDRPATTLAPVDGSSGTKVGVAYAEQAEWLIVTADSGGRGGVAEGRRCAAGQDTDVQRLRRVRGDVRRRRGARRRVLAGASAHRVNQLALAAIGAFADGPGGRGAAAHRRLRGQPRAVRQAAVDVPDRGRAAGRGLHRLAHNRFGGERR